MTLATATQDTEAAQRRERMREIEADSAKYDGTPEPRAPARLLDAADFFAWQGSKKYIDVPFVSNQQLASIRNELDSRQGSKGGFAIDDGQLLESIEVGRILASPIRKHATVIRVGGGAGAKSQPTIVDSGEGTLREPNSAATEATPTFGSNSSFGIKFSSDLVKAPFELVEGNQRLVPMLMSHLARRVGRRQNRSFTLGNTAGDAQGLVDNVTVGVTAAAAGSVLIDEVIALTMSVDPEYLVDGSAVLMAHQTVLESLFKLKDGEGAYIWPWSVLKDVKVAPNNHMVSTFGTGLKPLIFGNIAAAYTIVDRDSRLIEYVERFVETGETAYELLDRTDGFVSDPAACKSLQLA